MLERPSFSFKSLRQEQKQLENHRRKLLEELGVHYVKAHNGYPSETCHYCLTHKQGIVGADYQLMVIRGRINDLGS